MAWREPINLEGRAAFVTGGSRGLGKACALALAEAGADVALAATDERTLKASAAAVEKLGRRAMAIPLDVTDPAASRRAVESAARELGRLDFLVNAAGICFRLYPMETSPGEFHRTLAVNVSGTFHLCTAAFPYLSEEKVRQAGGGSIVNFGSVAGLRARPNILAYAASKAAVHSLTQSLAADWTQYGIRVNAIIPGQFDTDMGAPLLSDPQALAAYLKRIPAGRVGQPEELAPLIVFLCSRLSSYMTGALVVADGGLTLQ
ncbi:MAG: glucose 1-dehydrogenase [Nitrospinota bacterium]